MAHRICKASGKVAFVRHQEAEKVLARYPRRKRGLAEVPLSTYRCATCQRWHVSGLTPAETADYTRIRGQPPKAGRKKSMSNFKRKDA